MQAHQREIREVVIEIDVRQPAIRCMALRALGPELAGVHVIRAVAGRAVARSFCVATASVWQAWQSALACCPSGANG